MAAPVLQHPFFDLSQVVRVETEAEEPDEEKGGTRRRTLDVNKVTVLAVAAGRACAPQEDAPAKHSRRPDGAGPAFEHNLLAIVCSNHQIVLRIQPATPPGSRAAVHPQVRILPWFPFADKRILTLTFSPRGESLLAVTQDGSVYIIPILSLLSTPVGIGPNGALSLAAAPDGLPPTNGDPIPSLASMTYNALVDNSSLLAGLAMFAGKSAAASSSSSTVGVAKDTEDNSSHSSSPMRPSSAQSTPIPSSDNGTLKKKGSRLLFDTPSDVRGMLSSSPLLVKPAVAGSSPDTRKKKKGSLWSRTPFARFLRKKDKKKQKSATSLPGSAASTPALRHQRAISGDTYGHQPLSTESSPISVRSTSSNSPHRVRVGFAAATSTDFVSVSPYTTRAARDRLRARPAVAWAPAPASLLADTASSTPRSLMSSPPHDAVMATPSLGDDQGATPRASGDNTDVDTEEEKSDKAVDPLQTAPMAPTRRYGTLFDVSALPCSLRDDTDDTAVNCLWWSTFKGRDFAIIACSQGRIIFINLKTQFENVVNLKANIFKVELLVHRGKHGKRGRAREQYYAVNSEYYAQAQLEQQEAAAARHRRVSSAAHPSLLDEDDATAHDDARPSAFSSWRSPARSSAEDEESAGVAHHPALDDNNEYQMLLITTIDKHYYTMLLEYRDGGGASSSEATSSSSSSARGAGGGGDTASSAAGHVKSASLGSARFDQDEKEHEVLGTSTTDAVYHLCVGAHDTPPFQPVLVKQFSKAAQLSVQYMDGDGVIGVYDPLRCAFSLHSPATIAHSSTPLLHHAYRVSPGGVYVYTPQFIFNVGERQVSVVSAAHARVLDIDRDVVAAAAPTLGSSPYHSNSRSGSQAPSPDQDQRLHTAVVQELFLPADTHLWGVFAMHPETFNAFRPPDEPAAAGRDQPHDDEDDFIRSKVERAFGWCPWSEQLPRRAEEEEDATVTSLAVERASSSATAAHLRTRPDFSYSFMLWTQDGVMQCHWSVTRVEDLRVRICRCLSHVVKANSVEATAPPTQADWSTATPAALGRRPKHALFEKPSLGPSSSLANTLFIHHRAAQHPKELQGITLENVPCVAQDPYAWALAALVGVDMRRLYAFAADTAFAAGQFEVALLLYRQTGVPGVTLLERFVEAGQISIVWQLLKEEYARVLAWRVRQRALEQQRAKQQQDEQEPVDDSSPELAGLTGRVAKGGAAPWVRDASGTLSPFVGAVSPGTPTTTSGQSSRLPPPPRLALDRDDESDTNTNTTTGGDDSDTADELATHARAIPSPSSRRIPASRRRRRRQSIGRHLPELRLGTSYSGLSSGTASSWTGGWMDSPAARQALALLSDEAPVPPPLAGDDGLGPPALAPGSPSSPRVRRWTASSALSSHADKAAELHNSPFSLSLVRGRDYGDYWKDKERPQVMQRQEMEKKVEALQTSTMATLLFRCYVELVSLNRLHTCHHQHSLPAAFVLATQQERKEHAQSVRSVVTESARLEQEFEVFMRQSKDTLDFDHVVSHLAEKSIPTGMVTYPQLLKEAEDLSIRACLRVAHDRGMMRTALRTLVQCGALPLTAQHIGFLLNREYGGLLLHTAEGGHIFRLLPCWTQVEVVVLEVANLNAQIQSWTRVQGGSQDFTTFGSDKKTTDNDNDDSNDPNEHLCKLYHQLRQCIKVLESLLPRCEEMTLLRMSRCVDPQNRAGLGLFVLWSDTFSRQRQRSRTNLAAEEENGSAADPERQAVYVEGVALFITCLLKLDFLRRTQQQQQEQEQEREQERDQVAAGPPPRLRPRGSSTGSNDDIPYGQSVLEATLRRYATTLVDCCHQLLFRCADFKCWRASAILHECFHQFPQALEFRLHALRDESLQQALPKQVHMDAVIALLATLVVPVEETRVKTAMLRRILAHWAEFRFSTRVLEEALLQDAIMSALGPSVAEVLLQCTQTNVRSPPRRPLYGFVMATEAKEQRDPDTDTVHSISGNFCIPRFSPKLYMRAMTMRLLVQSLPATDQASQRTAADVRLWKQITTKINSQLASNQDKQAVQIKPTVSADDEMVAFTCGHALSKKQFLVHELPAFFRRLEQLPVPLMITSKLLALEYSHTVMHVVCPSCLLDVIKRDQQRKIESVQYKVRREVTHKYVQLQQRRQHSQMLRQERRLEQEDALQLLANARDQQQQRRPSKLKYEY